MGENIQNDYNKKPKRKRRRTCNSYEFYEDYITGIIIRSNGETVKFYIDIDDYDKIKIYKWCVSSKGYIKTTIDGRELQIHRLIMDLEDSAYEVDHINRNKKDNRKINLRVVTHSQNLYNKTSRNKNGISGIKLDDGRWTASIKASNKSYYLGSFNTKEEAIIARLKAEKELHGDFSPNKHLFEKYNIN